MFLKYLFILLIYQILKKNNSFILFYFKIYSPTKHPRSKVLKSDDRKDKLASMLNYENWEETNPIRYIIIFLKYKYGTT